MHVLHATALEDHALFLWAEDADASPPLHATADGTAASLHPFAAFDTRVQRVLARMLDLIESGSVHPDELFPTTRVDLHLPTLDGRPLPSPILCDTVHKDAVDLQPWSVEGVVLAFGEAAAVLARRFDPPPSIRLGDDFTAWTTAARFVLALLADGRFAPSPLHEGRWRPALDAVGPLLDVLIASTPPSACCHAADEHPAAALRRFLDHAVDALARHWIRRARLSAMTLSAHWPAEVARGVEMLLRGEVAPDVEPAAALYLGLRLREPTDDEGECWPLELIAQDASGTLRPAADLPAEALTASLRRFLDQVERDGANLPAPSRLLEGQPLSRAQAARFITEIAPRLSVPLDLPPCATARPRLSLAVADGGAEAPAFGLDALLRYEWRIALGGEAVDAEEFARLTASKIPLVRMREAWTVVSPETARATLDLFEARDRRMTLRDAFKLSARMSTAFADGTAVLPIDVHWAGTLASLDDPRKAARAPVPADFRATLRPYQLDGYSWLVDRVGRGIGACLADDMGLGKTIQVIALLLHERGRGPWLLVCPMSLLGNWKREMARFAPTLRVGIYHGGARGEAPWRDCDAVVTTYAQAAREGPLSEVTWRGIVLDEAQQIKNADAQQSRAVRALHGRARVALSGTPVENRLTDLWAIMDFLNPGLFGSESEFRRHFAVPIERHGDDARREALRRMVAPFLLRRVKTDPHIVPELLAKTERKIYCPLTREQASLYEATVRERLTRVDGCAGITRRGAILSTMLHLKQICNHPAQFLEEEELEARSGKLTRLVEMLETVLANGERALVFTQFRGFCEKLAAHLGQRLGVEVLTLHGETARDERDRRVARFQSDGGPPIFVLSIKAGGVGLTLTRAAHVFHYDRWWNPAVENQATDRAFRIGQTAHVQVYKLICMGTLEESIDGLLDAKRDLAESVVDGGEGWLTELTTAQLRDLFMLRDGVDVDERAALEAVHG